MQSNIDDVEVGSIIKFTNVKFSTGINNLSGYKSSGKFVCEKDGLYLISATVMYSWNDGEFYTYVNGKMYTQSYKHQESYWWHSSTAIIAIEPYTNDTVWVQTGG